MTTVSRGLIKYEGPVSSESESRTYADAGVYGDGWQAQVDMAASCLAAAALTGGLPRVHTMHERQLARYLSAEVAKKRRVAYTKIATIMLGSALAMAVGCYIGLLS